MDTHSLHSMADKLQLQIINRHFILGTCIQSMCTEGSGETANHLGIEQCPAFL